MSLLQLTYKIRMQALYKWEEEAICKYLLI